MLIMELEIISAPKMLTFEGKWDTKFMLLVEEQEEETVLVVFVVAVLMGMLIILLEKSIISLVEEFWS